MNKLCLLACLLMPVVANAQPAPNQTAPKVVFVGDYITYQWASAFTANPNWINQGNPAAICCYSDPAINMAAVEALHPAAVHIMIGLAWGTATDDASTGLSVPEFLDQLNALVQQAKAANIKVILGIEPYLPLNAQYLQQLNAVLATYGATYNIPVINYGDALCNCVGATTEATFSTMQSGPNEDIFGLYGPVGGAYMATPTSDPFPPPALPWDNDTIVTPQGYNLMTQLAESVINTMNLKLVTGWLSDIEQLNNNIGVYAPSPTNFNSVTTPAVVKFIPIGYYSDGSQHALINSTFQGSSGTWTSSNPLVMYVSQTGLAWAISTGTARITYTSPTGVVFSPWVMYVYGGGDGGPAPPCCAP
jgi:hypothetical protein